MFLEFGAWKIVGEYSLDAGSCEELYSCCISRKNNDRKYVLCGGNVENMLLVYVRLYKV